MQHQIRSRPSQAFTDSLPYLTSAEDDALVGNLISRLEARAVPAMPPELVLALVDGNLNALDG